MNPRDEKFFADLRRAVFTRARDDLNDAQLLTRYVDGRDETAIEALVWRHGPMVWGVCRRTLANQQDAEDAFQATFLVLVRKAASVSPRDRVGNWLYGVARQTALKARGAAGKRRFRERQVATLPERPASAGEPRIDDLSIIDRELSRLPPIYRSAILLCDLEGKTRADAARRLAVPEGTLAARLSRGREMLAKRLARHVITGAALAAAGSATTGDLPAAAVASAIKAATLFAAGQTAVAEVVSANVIALTQGVLAAMLWTKIKTVSVVALLAGFLAVGGGWLLRESSAAQDEPSPAAAAKPPEKEPVLWGLGFTVVDLVPQKGEDGKIGPPKGPIREDDFSGPELKILLRTDSPLWKLKSDGVSVGSRNLDVTGVGSQTLSFGNDHSKPLPFLGKVDKAGKSVASLMEIRLGTHVAVEVHLAEDRSANINLIFEDSQIYPLDIGPMIFNNFMTRYAYGMRPKLDVGRPPVVDDAGREIQPYDVVKHTLKTKLTISRGHTVLAKGLQATSHPLGIAERAPGGDRANTSCPPQILLLVTNRQGRGDKLPPIK